MIFALWIANQMNFLQHIHISERRKLLVSLYKQLLYREKKKFCFAYLQSNMKLKIVTGISLDFCEI